MSVSGSGDLAPSCTPCHPVLGHHKAPGTQGMLKVFGSEHSIFKGGFVVVFNLKHHLPLPPPPTPNHLLWLSAHILPFWKKVQRTDTNEKYTPD